MRRRFWRWGGAINTAWNSLHIDACLAPSIPLVHTCLLLLPPVSLRARQLEALNPTPEPNEARAALGGAWRLAYTSNSELVALLALGRLPLVSVGAITQNVDPLAMTVENRVELEAPLRWARVGCAAGLSDVDSCTCPASVTAWPRMHGRTQPALAPPQVLPRSRCPPPPPRPAPHPSPPPQQDLPECDRLL